MAKEAQESRPVIDDTTANALRIVEDAGNVPHPSRRLETKSPGFDRTTVARALVVYSD